MTTKHVNKSSGATLKTSEATYRAGTTYRTSPDSDLLFDYNLSGAPDGETTGTVNGNKTITYYYSDGVNSYDLTVKFVDQSGTELASAQTKKLKEGTEYLCDFESVSGYELDTENLPKNSKGRISADTTVTYVYKKVQSEPIKVHYYNSNGWSKVCIYAYDDSGETTKLLTGDWPGTAMTSDGGNMYSYTISGASSAKVMFTDGADTNTQQEPGANQPGYEANGEIWVQNQTLSFNAKVVVSYIDEKGNKLAEDKVISGQKVTSGDKYTTEGLSSQTTEPIIIGNAQGSWSAGVKNVIYMYPSGEPIGDVILGDVDQNGEVKLADAILIQKTMVTGKDFTGNVKRAADVVNLRDAIIIQNYTIGLIKKDLGIGKAV